MKLVLIGVGHAGGHIADTFYRHDEETGIGVVEDALAINSSYPDLLTLRHLEGNRRILIGGDIVDGHGVGSDCEQGAKVMHDDMGVVLNRIDDLEMEDADAFLVIGSLGGGMGSGGQPVLSHYLNERYNLPVYSAGILPGDSESPYHHTNTIRSLRTLVNETENVILFDNDTWLEEDMTIRQSLQSINDRIVVYLNALFGASEPLSGNSIGEQVIDTADITRTLDQGNLSVIGYSDIPVTREERGFFKELLSREKAPVIDTSDDILELVKESALRELSVEVDLDRVNAVTNIIAGPEDALSHEGIEEAQQWLTDYAEGATVRVGDYPIEPNADRDEYLASVSLLSGIEVIKKLVLMYDEIVGVETIPAVEEKGEVGASQVMEEFFTNEAAPEPLFGSLPPFDESRLHPPQTLEGNPAATEE